MVGGSTAPPDQAGYAGAAFAREVTGAAVARLGGIREVYVRVKYC